MIYHPVVVDVARSASLEAPFAGPSLKAGDRTSCSSITELADLWPGAAFLSDEPKFYANALRLRFGEFRIETTANSAYRCERTRLMVEKYPRPAISIETVLEGSMRRRQQGLEYRQSAGMVAITMLNEPFQFSWSTSGRSIRTVAEVAALEPRLRRPLAVRAGLVQASPLVTSYAAFVAGLVDVAEPGSAGQQTLGDSLFALHQNVLIEALEVSTTPTTLREQIEELVHESLGDPDLSPTSIAATLFVSVRAVHTAFNVDGVTLAAEIRRQRVLAAARILQEGGVLPVSRLAERVGFRGADTLRRSFNAVLGIGLAEYRQRLDLPL